MNRTFYAKGSPGVVEPMKADRVKAFVVFALVAIAVALDMILQTNGY